MRPLAPPGSATGGNRDAPGQKKIASADGRRSDSQIDWTSLANLGPHRTAIALQANSATGEQIGYGGNGFLGVLRAGTHRDDQVTEGEFRAGLEDLCLFHGIGNKLEQLRCHFVQT